MKSSLLLLAGAAALSLASCSQTKTTETTTTTPADASAGTAMTTTTTDVTYKSRGSRMADKFAADMKITDEATREKLRTAYFNRSKRYGEMRAKYGTDTAGMGAAMRQYRTDTDTEFKGILTNADQFKSYESSRSTYDEANNMSDEPSGAMSGASTGSGAASTDNSAGGSGTMSGGETSAAGAATGATVESGKTKMADGSKIKVKEDGTVKIKDADGNKTKMKM